MQPIHSKEITNYKPLKILGGKSVHAIELYDTKINEWDDGYHYLVSEKIKVFDLAKAVYHIYFRPGTPTVIKELLLTEYKKKFPNVILSTAINFYVEDYEEVDFAMKNCDFIFLQAGLELFEQTVYTGDDSFYPDEDENIFIGNKFMFELVYHSLLKTQNFDVLTTTPKTKLIQLGYDTLYTIYSAIGADAETAMCCSMKRYFTEF